MDLKKAQQIQEDITEKFLENNDVITGNVIPNTSRLSSINAAINGVGIRLNKKTGYSLAIYTCAYVSRSDIANYLGMRQDDFEIDYIGDIRILGNPAPGCHITHPMGAIGTMGGYVLDKEGIVYLL